MKRLLLVAFVGIFLFVENYVQAQHRPFLRQENKSVAPNYADLYYWAASPYKHDMSDSIPAFIKNESRDSSVDVFYIHPTSYMGGGKTAPWNPDLNDTGLNNQTDLRPVLHQASVFNGSCRIFAPRYRQAHLKAFFEKNNLQAQAAFNLAYSDVKKAFQYYLQHENKGRPIIIASHSQGTLHAIRLLQDFFDGTKLQKQLVCAYLIGYQIPKESFKHIPLGTTANATGCFVTWRTYQKGEMPLIVKKEEGNSQCVNPLNWSTSTEWVGEQQHDGAMETFNELIPHSVSARIEPELKILWVSLSDDFKTITQKIKNLHIYDYNLFWMNIRENVKQRVDAYNQQHALAAIESNSNKF